MKAHYALREGRLVLLRLPYPQTPASASLWITAHGACISALARANGLPRLVLQDLLRGQLKGFRGHAHLAAIVLGLKPPPGSAAANDPAAMPARRGAGQARRVAA